MLRLLMSAAALAALAAGASAQEVRQLAPHVHGESRLGIALDGSLLSIELESPAMDIVGFEHAPATDQDRAAIEDAKQALADPLALFGPTSAAGCTLSRAEVEHVLEDDDHDHDHAEGGVADADHDHDEEAHHSAFAAHYDLDCADPAALTGFDFGFFERFPGAQHVELQFISGAGQGAAEVERDAPQVVLGDLLK